MLLPQSEVQAPKQLPEAKPKTKNHTTQSARKRSREYIKEEEHCRVDCFDSDSCASSDDTIDEFISSEDLSEANRRTFSRVNDKSSASLSSKVLGLPSMLSTRYTSAIGRTNQSLAAKIGEELKRVSESRSSSGSITVGSLEQTSLELSDDSNSEETTTVTTRISKSGTTNAGSGTAIVTTNKSGTTTTSVRGDNSQARQGKELIDREGCVDKIEKESSNEQGLTLLQPSLDLSLDDCSPFKLERRNDRARENDRKIKDGRCGRKEKELLPAACEEEWHLTLECSSEEEKKMDTSSECTNNQKDITMIDETHDTKPLTPKSGDSAVLPPAKRKKRSRERKRRSHHHREQTDLSTPVEGEMVATTTPRKLFHERELKKNCVKKDRKKHRKSKSEAEKNKVKETKIIDLTQDDDEELNQTAVVTGINDVINKEKKGKSPTQNRPPAKTSNYDHHSDKTSNNNNRMDQAISSSSNFIPEPKLEIDHELEVDSDITFCEECSENTTDTLGSPFYLPPTPGRENVSSILKRKSIAFSD